MSIRVQFCAVEIMLILLYFYKSQKKVNLQTERAFFRMFCVVFASIVLDITSCFVIRNMERFPELFTEIVCKTYLVSFVGMSLFILQYIGSELFPVTDDYRRALIRYSAFAAAGVAAIYILPIEYHYEPETKALYTTGLSVIVTYAFSFVTIMFVLFKVFRLWKKMNKFRRDGLLIGVANILLAAIVQFFIKDMLIISFAVSICMVVLYLKLENPGHNIDTRTGLFNQNAFNQLTSQLYNNRQPFSVIEIVYKADLISSADLDEILNEAVYFLLSQPHILSFKTVGSEIIVLIKDPQKADLVFEKLKERFEQGWGRNGEIVIKPLWILIPDPFVVSSTNELMNTLRYVRQNSAEFPKIAVVDEELAARINDEKRITDLIAKALVEDRVEVYYQPIYSVKEHLFTAAEALVRIRDEDGRVIPPGEFIKVAESNGMILKLGEEVFRKVCYCLSGNDLKSMGLRYVEVNLSVIQCGYEKLADDFIGIMEQNNISPDMINLEITESASLDTKNTLLNNMHKLMDFGVNFSLDDFGTGQSNLNYMIDMPVEIVKFDREMTNAYFENSRAKYVMDAAMKMIQGMDLDIVVEGVENQEQLCVMEDLNISYIQGFYFSKPLPVTEFINFLAMKNRF